MTSLPDIAVLAESVGLGPPSAAARIVVAMSGGVDSSVVAGILKHAGYDVVGVTLQLYDHGEAVHRSGSCCAGRDIQDARRVAASLGIPHYVLDYEERFRDEVMASFADSYIAGETPIPCVSCNQQIKFKDLLRTARELGAAALATGHYIRTVKGPHGWEMHRPKDTTRDQSYFLFATTREQLAFLRFPLGEFTKDETREIARALHLPVAAKADSQDICFVPSGHYSQVVERLRPGAAEEGAIVHVDGRVLGRHPGIVNYTIGQRRGLGVAASEPLYVVRLDAARREVVVGPRSVLRTARLWLREVNWIGDRPLAQVSRGGLELYVRLRSTQAPQFAILHVEPAPEGVRVRVDLPEGEDGVSPGQACVFYSAGQGPARILGGGVIARTGSVFDEENAAFSAAADPESRRQAVQQVRGA